MTLRSFILETLTIFLGDVLATGFVALLVYVVWYVIKYPGFRVGASWSFNGWNVKKMGRFPTASDSGTIGFTPNVTVTSYDAGVKKVIHSVWVRQRADVFDPGEILGHRDLRADGIPADERTTGGDLLTFQGPAINRPTSKFHEVVNFPIFIETSDGVFYKAESIGNTPTGVRRLRYRYRNAIHKIRQQVFAAKSYVRRKL